MNQQWQIIKNTKKPCTNKCVVTKSKTATRNKDITVVIKRHIDKQGEHPHFIYGDIDNKHISVGITSKKKKGKNGSQNYALGKNPFGGTTPSYMRRQGTVALKSTFYCEKKGFMTKKDHEQAKHYGELAKKKYIEKKQSKNKDNKKSNIVPNLQCHQSDFKYMKSTLLFYIITYA